MNLFYYLIKNAYRAVWEGLFEGEAFGLENIPLEGSFLLACNHASYFDPPFIGGSLRRPVHFFARKTLFKPGLPEQIMSALNCIPVDRDGDSDIAAFKKVLAILKEGGAVGIFPEGTRTRDGNLQKAKRGVGLMACKASVPVVPVRLWGTFEAWPKGSTLPRLGTQITAVFGRPLQPNEFDPGPEQDQRYQITADRIMEAIAALRKPQIFWE